MFHATLERAVACLDASDPLRAALEAMRRCSLTKKAAILKAMKHVLSEVTRRTEKGSTDGPDVLPLYVPILVELAFLENACFMYQGYMNSIKGLPGDVLKLVMAGWVTKLKALDEKGSVEGSEHKHIDDVSVLELVSTILAVDAFAAIWEQVADLGLRRAERVLDTALREAGGALMNSHSGRFDEVAEKRVEKAASIGYAIVSKGASTLSSLPPETTTMAITMDRGLMRQCLGMAVDAIGMVEEPKVEYVLALLIGSLGCALVGREQAVRDVLCACFGSGSDVVGAYGKLSVVKDCDEFYEALGPLGARAFVVCATMAAVIYGEVRRLDAVPTFSETFSQSICSLIEVEHKHTLFVRLYCVDALSAYLGAYLHASREDDVGQVVLSETTKMRVMDSLAIRSLSCDEYVARRITDGFLRVMFAYDTHQARSLGEPARLAVYTISVCAGMPVSKAKFRLWDAIFQQMQVPDVLGYHPGFVMETVGVVSTNTDVRASAALALRHVWKSLRFVEEHGGTKYESSEINKVQVDDGAWFDVMTSDRIVQDVAIALLDADVAEDGTLDSIVAYVLPGLFESCRDSFFALLGRLEDAGRDHAADSTSKCSEASRSPLAAVIGLLSAGRRAGCYASFRDLNARNIDSFGVLREAVVDSREGVRLAALELLCAGSVSTIDIPVPEELAILWQYYETAMLCTSALSRQQNITSCARFLTRIKVSAAATLTRPRDFERAEHAATKECESWVQRFCRMCIACIHPGAVYGKKLMAIELLFTAMEVFKELVKGYTNAGTPTKLNAGFEVVDANDHIVAKTNRRKAPKQVKGFMFGTGLMSGAFVPFPEELYSAYTRDNLFGALADNFERIRSLAMSINLMLPPLSSVKVRDLLEFAFEFVRRPRLSDQDAGACMMNIVHEQFLIPGTWKVHLRSLDDFDVVHIGGEATRSRLKFIGTLSSVAIVAVPDVSHLGLGLAYLALLRHLIAGASFSKSDDMETFALLVQLVEHTVQLIMPVLSCPEESVVDEVGEDGANQSASLADLINSRASEEQLLRCRSWMASREVCFIVESLWEAVPPEAHALFQEGLRATVDALMDVLLRAQHYGSIDSAKVTLQRICSTRGGSGALVEDVTQSSVSTLFDHMLRSAQSRRDAIRRSGGMPFGLQSVMVSGPKSRISREIMERLLEICSSSPSSTPSGDDIEGTVYWPKVHALNTLRLVFSDPRLSALDRFHGTGFTVVLKSLSDPNWEIQNSAALCFTSLVISKVMGGGAGNVRRVDHIDLWPPRALSAEGFLGRYREVDQFMVDVLESQDDMALLAPVLALLGRLRPQSSLAGVGSRASSRVGRGAGTSAPDEAHESNEPGHTVIQRYGNSLVRHLDSPQIYIRKLAARACVSVVPATSWSDFVVMQPQCGDSDDNSHINHLHGRLCLAVEVFKAIYSLPHYAEGAHEGLYHAAAASFCNTYGDRTQIGRMPPACHAELLKACILMSRMESNFPDERVLAFCATVVDELWVDLLYGNQYGRSRVSTLDAPMSTVAMKRLVKLALSWVLPRASEMSLVSHLEWCDRLLCHPTVEVREATVKSLVATGVIRQALDRRDDSRISDITELLLDRLSSTWQHETAYYAKLWTLKLTNSVGRAVTIPDWRQFALNPLLLAEIVRSLAYADSDALTQVLQETSQPYQTEEVRTAAVDAFEIRAAILLNPERLELLSCAMKLMVDEEETVRSRMAHLVHCAVLGADTCPSTSAHSRAEVVQELVFPWLLSRCNFSLSSVAWCFGFIVDCPSLIAERIRDRIKSRNTHRLFLVEKANQHEDPLTYARLASRALMDTRYKYSESDTCLAFDWLRSAGTACGKALKMVISDATRLTDSLHLGDTLGLRQQIYEDVTRLWLAVRTVDSCLGGGSPAAVQRILGAATDVPLLFRV